MADEFKDAREAILGELQALRAEVSRLREQMAEHYGKPRPASAIDWGQPFMVGTPSLPRLVPMEPMAPGTIICNSGANHG